MLSTLMIKIDFIFPNLFKLFQNTFDLKNMSAKSIGYVSIFIVTALFIVIPVQKNIAIYQANTCENSPTLLTLPLQSVVVRFS